MTEVKKSFAERYPNYRTERRNERISQMIPATGWWKTSVWECSDKSVQSIVEPVAFFATVEYEERSVWDGGSGSWEKCQILHANIGTGDEWFMHYIEAITECGLNERLFYDADYRLSQDSQFAGNSWIQERKAEIKKKQIKTID